MHFSYLQMTRTPIALISLLAVFTACNNQPEVQENTEEENDSLQVENNVILEGETHFKSLKQLTNGGDNAEAYWSFNDDMLVFQATNDAWDIPCDQIFYFDPSKDDIMTEKAKMLSTGLGRTTCAYFMPGDSTVLYASTHQGNEACPPVPERREDGKYVWPIYPDFDIYVTDLQGNIINQLTKEPGYDAEATLSPNGDKIVFTSIRSGDLELYTMNIDGSDVRQITDELGYDGGAFFSPDGTKLVFRASRPKSKEDIDEYKSLLKDGLVMPTSMEIYTCNVDGSDLKQITSLGQANWCPFFHPSGEKIIFSSNHTAKRGFPFNLYMIDINGENLEKVTSDETFDAFPVFSYSGKHLVFSSNRNNGGTRSTNLFLAEWKD